MTRRPRRALARLRWLAFLVLFAALGLAGYFGVAWYWWPVVSVTKVVEAPVVQAFYATGTISPDREYPLRANVAGILVQCLVDKGDAVKKDQPVAVIASDDLTFRLEQAKAELVEKAALSDDRASPILADFDARITAYKDILAVAQREYERVKAMFEVKAASDQDLDRAIDRLRSATSDYESTRAQRATKKLQLEKDTQIAQSALKTAQWNFDQQTIRSPIDGVVLDWPVSQGTRVAVNDHLMQIANVSPGNLVMRAAVDEEDKVSVVRGKTVRMTLYSFPGEVLTGKVSKVYDKAESARRTFEVDIEIDAADPHRAQLSPGMTGELAFVVAEKPAANVLPAQAVQAGDVMIVRNGRLERIHATLGLTSLERVEVTSGVKPDDLVVISPTAKLTDGQRVRTRFVDPLTAAGMNKHPENKSQFKGFH